MRLMLFVASILAFRLALAPGAVAQLATAQAAEGAAGVPRRVEIGGGVGAMAFLPELGLLASVPLDKDSSVEVVVSRMAPLWHARALFLTQVQLRLPFREHLRSRKSFLLGVTRLSALDSDEGFLGTDSTVYVRPHAGVSLQWPTAPTLDFRLDLQGVLTFERELPLIPRAMAVFVWHQVQHAAASRPTR